MAERAANPDAPLQPVRRDIGGIEVLLPTGLQRITFGQSERDARLQLADVLARGDRLNELNNLLGSYI